MRNKVNLPNNSWAMLDDFKANAIIASLLSFLAGTVNSISTISILFHRSTHVSGRIADIGINIFTMPTAVLFVTIIWLAFVLGSYIAALLMPKIGLTRSLILQSVALFGVAILVSMGISAGSSSDYSVERSVIAFLLPLIMGFQNSITTQLPLERTTHWTGASTDLGIAIANKNLPFVVFTSSKIFAFILGAAMMSLLVGVLKIPPYYGLAISSILLGTTAVICERVDRSYKV